MDAAEARERILKFLDAHYRVPPGSMIRVGGLWTCGQCRGDLLIGRPGELRFACDQCGSPVGQAVRSLPSCCRRPFRVAGGDLYDSDHYLEEEDLTAALCDACHRIQAVVPGPAPAITLDLRALPDLMKRYSDPALQDEVEAAVRAIVAAAPADPAPVPPDVAERIRQRVARLEGGWPTSVAKEHGAFPLHESASLYLWSLRPDGAVLCSDLDTALNTTEEVGDPLVRFVMILRGSAEHPELAALLRPPRGCAPCRLCRATGRSGEFDCGRCRGLGWVPG